MTEDTTTLNRIGRRNYLALTAVAATGLAGCSSESGDGAATSAGSPTPGGELATPVNTVRTFYETLYGNDDIEAANELYHPESDADPLGPPDFEQYGGVGSISADLQSTEVTSKGETVAEVHATVDYTTPIGGATHVDWFDLRIQDDEWLVDLFYPESARPDGATDT